MSEQWLLPCRPDSSLIIILLFILIRSLVRCEIFRECIANCCDTHNLCKFWARSGECEKNPSWMLPNCANSCNSCNQIRRFRIMPNGRFDCTNATDMEAVPRLMTTSIVMDGSCARTNVPNPCFRDVCFHQHFRTFDGSCNNFDDSIQGAAFTPFIRLLPAHYDDGISVSSDSIRRSRPNARIVSRMLISSQRTIASHVSSMLMQFGQFLSHDMSKNKLSGNCGCSGGPECLNILLNPDDKRIRKAPCIPFKRSVPVCGTGRGHIPREQLNENTAFIDASQVYGSDATNNRRFRAGTLSLLSMVPIGGRMFPPMGGENTFNTGDDRSNLFLGLAALHTVFVRLHNKIDADLRHMNHQWSENRRFQETRKIVGAIMQVITYKEFLPALLGSLYEKLIPPYIGYNRSVNAGISNEFAGAAYRLHGLIQEFYELRDRNFGVVGSARFVESTFQVQRIIRSGIDSLIRGLVSQPARLPQRITFQMTELFGGGMLDMASINIMRGRDHGFPTYNHYRSLCKLQPVLTFDDWPEVGEVKVRERVKELYGSPENLDFYVGGVIEDPLEGSIIGPTFACIIAEQFTRSRDGDRFFFENPEQFTREQIIALRTITLSHVLCITADDMPLMPLSAFILGNHTVVPCELIPGLDLSPWRI